MEDRRTQGGLGVEYLVSGGLDDLSQSILPQQHGPVATAELEKITLLRVAKALAA